MIDPIVEEVRKARDDYAAQFNYDLDAMVADLREKQKRSGRTFVNYGKPTNEPPTPSEGVKEPLLQSALSSNLPSSPAEPTAK